MTPIVLQVQLSAEQTAQLERAMRLTPAEVEAIAAATAVQLKQLGMQSLATMTVKEFAVQARVTVQQVYKLIKRGQLEAVRPNGSDRRITAAAAAKYFAGVGNGNA